MYKFLEGNPQQRNDFTLTKFFIQSSFHRDVTHAANQHRKLRPGATDKQQTAIGQTQIKGDSPAISTEFQRRINQRDRFSPPELD